MIDNNKSIEEVEKVLQQKSNFRVKPEDFDKCIDHIIHLIDDAATLYKKGSYCTSAFLSITIIEEVAKIHMGLFIHTPNSNEKVKRSKDPLFSHKTKQIIGANYTVSMGSRLQKAIGQQQMEKIFDIAYTENLSQYRESSLYIEFKDGKICVPSEVIDKTFSKSILLFAIESFDDSLVGYDEYSLRISAHTDTLFSEIANQI